MNSVSAQPTTQTAQTGQPAPVPESASPPTLNDYISISPEIRFGKPCIAGTRIAVIDVAIWHNQLGMSHEQIAGDYNLDLPSAYASLLPLTSLLQTGFGMLSASAGRCHPKSDFLSVSQ